MGDGGRRHLTGIVTALVAAMLALGGGTYLWTTRNGERIVDRDLRELARMVREVEGRVGNLHTVLANLEEATDSAEARRRVELIPGARPRQIDSFDLAGRGGSNATLSDTTRLRVSAGLGSLVLTYVGELESGDSVVIEADWSLDELAPSLRSDYFEMTLLAQTKGEVLLHVPEMAGIRVQNLSALRDTVAEPEGPSDSTRVQRPVTQIRRATVAGREYRVFIQPLRISFKRSRGADVDSLRTWYLAGLVPERRFSEERLALGPAVLLALGLLLAVGVLAWPFLRAGTMGPRERLRVRHLLALVGALTLIGGGIGIALADLAHYERLERDIYRQTGRLADRLRENLRSEVRAALRQLDAFTTTLSAQTAERFPGIPLDSLARVDPEADPGVLQKVRLPSSSVPDYPMLTMAYWMSSAGQQIAKWTPRRTNTSLVSVAGREYFRAIREGAAWPLDTLSDADSVTAAHLDPRTSRPYFIESIRTWTTGEKSAAISTDVSWPDGSGIPGGDAAAAPWVGAVLTRLASLDRPVLPPGVSFAVVDSTGRAWFHALEERAQEENLVEETGGDEVLRSTLIAHAQRNLDVDYRGQRTHLFVRPLPGTPWAVVVMLDKAQLETVRFETVFSAGSLYLVFCLAMLAWFVLIEIVVPRKMHWVWPDTEHSARYAALLVVLVVFVLLLCPPALLSASFGGRLVYLLIPFQGLGLGLVALSIATRHDDTMARARLLGLGLAGLATTLLLTAQAWMVLRGDEGLVANLLLFVFLLVGSVLAFAAVRLEYLVDRCRPPRHGVAERIGTAWTDLRDRLEGRRYAAGLYVASMVVGLLLLGVLPGYLLYRRAFDHHVELMARYHLVGIAEGLEARRARQDSIIRRDALGPGYDTALASAPYDLLFGSLPFEICRSSLPPVRSLAGRDAAPAGPAGAGVCRPDSLEVADAPAPAQQRLDDLVPFLGEASVAMRELRGQQANRQWLSAAPRAGPWLIEGSDTLHATLPARSSATTLLWWIALLAGVLLLACLVHWISRRVFLIDLWPAPSVQLREVLTDPDRTENLVVVCTRSTDRAVLREKREEWDVIDLMDPSVEKDGEPDLRLDPDKSVVCLDHADHRIQEAAWARALLAFLEPLVYVHPDPPRVILLTSQEPASLLSAEAPRESRDDAYVQRWARLLGQFARVAVRDSVGERFLKELREAAGDLTDPGRRRAVWDAIRVVVQECRRPALEPIGVQIIRTLPKNGLSRNDLIGRIREEADTYYGALWAVLGPQEKLVVAQLASGAVVNPSLEAAVARLLGRGILVRGPELRVMNESFERFAREKAPDSVIRQWELSGSASAWELIRTPFLLGLVALALFLFWTQRDVLGNAIAFLTTAGAGLAAIGRMVSLSRTSLASPQEKQ